MPFVSIDTVRFFYEVKGSGRPFVMLHAGVSDCRQWNNEFEHFSKDYLAIRHDQRGHGRTEPVPGKYRPLDDLTALLDQLQVTEPAILMGCSMGGGLAMDFTLTHPDRVAALIMVASGPEGLSLDVEIPEKFSEAKAAWESGDLDLACEIETQIWFDGMGRTPRQVDPAMRQLLYDMNRTVLDNESLEVGVRIPADTHAADRLDEIAVPVLVVVGEHDIPYMKGAADYMEQHLRNVSRVTMKDAAHLPNMDHPEDFQRIVGDFLSGAAAA